MKCPSGPAVVRVWGTTAKGPRSKGHPWRWSVKYDGQTYVGSAATHPEAWEACRQAVCKRDEEWYRWYMRQRQGMRS